MSAKLIQEMISVILVIACGFIGGMAAIAIALMFWWFWPITPEFAIRMFMAGFVASAAGIAYLTWRKP